jgi:chromosomal replication initiator protein
MVKTANTVWNSCLTLIKSKVGAQSFSTWFQPITPVSIEQDTLTIQVPSQFFYEWLEEHYVDVLREAIRSELGVSAKLKYSIIIDRGAKPNESTVVNIPNRVGGAGKGADLLAYTNPFHVSAPGIESPQLNPNYIFDSLIEGDCNLLARNAGLAVSNKPGVTSFKPLLIYGGTGLGKTHLVQSIGNQIMENDLSKKVLYVSSEKFANQVIEGFKNNAIQELANYYLQLDVLIIDDVQFLIGKEKTQEIFFHIFNHLHQSGKQVILTSDCAPKELKGLQERLISRFKWGLSAEISKPDFETRMAIILHKTAQDGIELSPEVVEYLAYSIDTNVRELEGVLISLIAQASLNKKEIDLELAKQALHSIVQNIEVEVNADYVQKFVSDFFDVSVELLKAKTRKREIVVARQVGMYLTKEFTNMSLKSIGYHYGGRDHTTVIHAISTVNDMMDTDQKFYAMMQDLLKKVKMKAG